MPQHSTQIRLDRELYEAVAIRCIREHMSIVAVIRRLLEGWMNGEIEIEKREGE